MPTQVLEEHLKNPYVKGFLDVVHGYESNGFPNDGYGTLYGGRQIDDFSRHPNVKVPIPGADDYSTAAGRYQFLNSTWNEIAQKYGLSDFGPHNQDLAAVALILDSPGNPMADILAGDYASAMWKLRPKWEGFNRAFPGGTASTYDGGAASASGHYPLGATETFERPERNGPGSPLMAKLEETLQSYRQAGNLETAPQQNWDSLVPMDEYYSGVSYGGGGGSGGSLGQARSVSGVPAYAIPETPEDAQILQRLASYPAEVSGRVLTVRQELQNQRGSGLVSMATPMPDINDSDLMNLINSVKV